MDKKSIRLKKDIEIAVKLIIEKMPENPIAILLCGGYGRGEGAWYLDENGEIQPYNDYDFAVISNMCLSRQENSDLRKAIACKVGIRWVDIDYYKPTYFNYLLPTIKNADLIYASKLVFGDGSIIRNSRLNLTKIGNPDIVKLYMTRIWTFLGSWEGDFHELDMEESRYFKNQMAKALLAAADIYLIKNRLYTPSYKERYRRVVMLDECNGDCEMYRWALQEKLHPSSCTLSEADMKELYFGIKDIFCRATQKTLPIFWISLKSILMGKAYIYTHTKYILHIIADYVNGNNMYSVKVVDNFMAQQFIFASLKRQGIDGKKLQKGVKLLKKWSYIEKDNDDFFLLRGKVAWIRNNI